MDGETHKFGSPILKTRSGGSSAWQSFRASLDQTILAGGDAVDVRLRRSSPSLPGVHADTGPSQVQILPARPLKNMFREAGKTMGGESWEWYYRLPRFFLPLAHVKSYMIRCTSAIERAICRVAGGECCLGLLKGLD